MMQDKATREYMDKIKASVHRADTRAESKVKKSKKVKKAKKSKKESETVGTIIGAIMIMLMIVAFWNFLSWIMP